jgi:hypothetical protein
MFGKEVPKHEIEAVLNNCGAKVFRNLTDLVRINSKPYISRPETLKIFKI